ncbi:hypothetical protein GJAV_G00161460 [Gymnothorax javanicus]|nr:hypothetical protein GJAV_G00161460 [Gymnothorax javanicus]
MTASTVGSGTCLAAKGLDISLAALKRQDPYINNIVDVASQVALYTFSNRANEWEKTDVEGTLFVYTRLASPRHGFTIMNRLSMDNLTEPITKDLDFQLQDPFLLYRNARLSIYGIWFYDKEDCLRIAELMKDLTRQEQLLAQRDEVPSPRALRTEDSRGVDILEMLTKARDEYDKGKPCSEPKEIASSSVIYDNRHLIKPIPVKPLERPQAAPQNLQDSDSEPRPLSLAALFGAQSQREHTPPQKLMISQRGPAELLQPVSESPENRLCENGGGLQPVHHCQGRDPLHRLFQNPAPAPPCCAHPPPPPLQPPPPLLHGQLETGRAPDHLAPKTLYFSPGKPPVTGVVSPHELLQRLQLVQQEQSLSAEPARPALAPRFQEPVLQGHAQHLPTRPLDGWTDKPSGPGAAEKPLFQGISPQRVQVNAPPTVLMSPMVFTQSKLARSSIDCSPALLPQTPEAHRTLTKSQLQATLLHLIQTDAAFLDTIYKAYVSSFSKDTVAKKL